MNNNTRKFFSFLIASVFTASASAALYDRGNGMIYDSTQNITWLQDVNYARTSGYDIDGQMNWNESVIWANNLVYGGYSDWHLPSFESVGGGAPYGDVPTSYDGSTDYGFNNTLSQIGHLYLEMGNVPLYDSSGVQNINFSAYWKYKSFVDPISQKVVSFENFPAPDQFFWERTSTITGRYGWGWGFYANYGEHIQQYKKVINANTYAWAVRDGDVLPVNEVPVPAASWLMGSGLIGLAGLARRKK